MIFTSVAAFDAHRVGSFGEPIYQMSRSGNSQHVIGHAPSTRRCFTVREIEALGLVRHDKGWWMLLKAKQEENEEALEIAL